MSYQRISGELPVTNSRVSFDSVQDDNKYLNTGKPPPKYGLQPATVHTLTSVAAGTVMTLFGYEQGVFGGIIVGDEFQEYFQHPSPGLTGFVTSIYDLGCFAGAILTLFVGEPLGRKRMLIVFTVLMASGIVLQTGAQNMQHLLWGRFLAGIGNGGNTATAPVWHVETSHQDAKGKAVVKEMVVNVLGFVISNICTLAFSHVTTEAQWRFPLGIQLLFVVIILGLVPILPESPRWLLARGRDSEAKSMLNRLNDGEVEEEFQMIRTSVREEMAVQASWAQILKGGTATRRMLLGMLLQVCQQLSGINVLCYYLPLVLHKSVGLDELPSRLLSTAIAILYMLSTASSICFVDRLGRRPLLMSMAAAMSVAFLGIAISTELSHGKGSFTPGVVATVFMTLYFLAFGFGWVSVPWLYPAEINSLSMRTKGAALATACDWLFNYIVVQTTPIGIHYLKWGLYLVYSILNACFVPIIYLLVVETAGMSLESIDRWFAENPGWLVHKIQNSPHRDLNDAMDRGEAEETQAMVNAYEGSDGDFDKDAREMDIDDVNTVPYRDTYEAGKKLKHRRTGTS